MTISFHGAARMVTGSKHLIEMADGTKLLLDCGLFQGYPKETDTLNRQWGFKPEEIDYLILSHAHIDHCGLIPRFVKEGFKGKIYCTPPTFDLAKILMLDAAHIQEWDVKYVNKRLRARHEPEVDPLYTTDDARNTFDYFYPVPYHEWHKIKEGIEFSFTDVGHIIGSASVHLRLTENGKETRLTFSGDVGRYDDDILNTPEVFEQADYVLIESTYGDSLHENTGLTTNKLMQVITDTCLTKKGKLIIPAFSVGRTQELVYLMNKLQTNNQLPPVDVFVDSPLSVEATEVIRDHVECYNKSMQEYMKRDPEPFAFKRLHYITEVEDSKKLNDHKEP
ncbi:MAG TPA: MBL fold metallo-hydrolase, partial [Chitinophagales bacterium]|nr:MBL fold metallo-hydrolase [Chitinophagales bacterium]